MKEAWMLEVILAISLKTSFICCSSRNFKYGQILWCLKLQPAIGNYHKTADQERSDINVVFTMILCVLKLQETLITSPSQLIHVSSQIWILVEAIWSLLVNISFTTYQTQK